MIQMIYIVSQILYHIYCIISNILLLLHIIYTVSYNLSQNSKITSKHRVTVFYCIYLHKVNARKTVRLLLALGTLHSLQPAHKNIQPYKAHIRAFRNLSWGSESCQYSAFGSVFRGYMFSAKILRILTVGYQEQKS